MEIGSVLVFALVAAAGAYLAYYFKKKRREALAATAFQIGLEFSPEDPFDCLSYPFALLGRGHGRGIENVMWGVWHGIPLRAFDYWYCEESTNSQGNRSRTYHRFSCAVKTSTPRARIS